MFEGKNSKKLEYLEDERKKLWQRLLQLEKQVAEKPSDIEKEAKQASKKAAEFRNRAEDRLNQATEILNHISEVRSTIDQKLNEITSTYNQVIETNENIVSHGSELSSILTKINEVLDKHPNIQNEISELDELIATIEENSSKANTTYKGILSKKSEIDELHREIIGYEDEDESGETISVEGLKSELEVAYESLSEKSSSLNNSINELKKASKEQYDQFIQANQDEIDKIKRDTENEYNAINQKIESLLPNALTAGLSSAFIAKKGEEEGLHKEYKRSFERGILYLSLVSILPIAISIFFLATGSTLIDVIERSPKVIISFLPLYIPLIWITISANKKVNLSKRLIEEYSHKQVLSMTIEGLSKQIENIENSELSEELRIKLISSFLEVTNENPGKLISNYQKSDNPILNMLDRDKREKSSKSIVETMKDKTKGIIEKAADEVEDDIASNGKSSETE